MVIPNSTIILLKCPISLDNKNQLTFGSKEEQYNYFINQPHEILDNATYQRKDGVIRYPDVIDNIIDYDYVMYQNESYSDKWFYAFITNMTYVNDGMTLINIITDVWQTWQFDIDIKRSFVEREMIDSSKDVPRS